MTLPAASSGGQEATSFPFLKPDALDQLGRVGIALNALADLLRPGDDMSHVDREDLAMLLALLSESDDPSAREALTAVTDLIGSSNALDGLMREHLYALLLVLARIHSTGMARVFSVPR